ncbi:MAG: ABC transporter permease [Phycisphaerales bacterium]
MTTLWQDIRYGLRMLARSPGFAGVVLLILGVGIGANAALFNALDQVSLRLLPVEKPRELVSVQFRYRDGAWEFIQGECLYSNYEAYRDRSEAFTALMTFKEQTWTLHVDEAVERIEGVAVSTNYFSTLGLRAAVGRLILPEQGQSPTDYLPVAVISHGLWHRRFEGRADVVGKQIVLDDQALTIVGVTPPGFTGTTVGHPSDIFVPVGTVVHGQSREIRDLGGLCLLGRLKPGVNREQAQAALQVLDAQMNPPKRDEPENRALVLEGSQGYVPKDAQVAAYPLTLFQGAAALVFAIACANIANLQLARMATRHKEIAVRQALGAGRWRVLRQLLVESLLLALAGGVCGLLLAVCLNRWICVALARIAAAAMPPDIQIHLTNGLHSRMLLFAAGISLLSGMAFGLTPAFAMLRRDVIPALKESGGCANLPARRGNLHNLLVVAQIAVALVVMVLGGLCLRSVVGLQRTDVGFDTRKILVVRLDLEGHLLDRPDLCRFMGDLQERVRRLPGVASAALATCPPVNDASGGGNVVDIEGTERPLGREVNWRMNTVGPEYFLTLGQALLAGRDFTVLDGPDTPCVVVINEVLAKRYWPNQSPIGKRISFLTRSGEPDVREVIGVVKCVKLRSILEEPVPVAYLALDQRSRGGWKQTPILLIRTEGNPHSLVPAIRKEASVIGSPAALDIRTVSQRIAGLLVTQRILSGILTLFGAVGLLLSATGIYAVMAYAVRQRTREIGIRIALGARGRDVVKSVLLKGALLMFLGLGLGGGKVLVSLLPRIREWDQYFLQGIHAWDPLTYVAAALVVFVMALGACYVPARRAARVDPMVALRCE